MNARSTPDSLSHAIANPVPRKQYLPRPAPLPSQSNARPDHLPDVSTLDLYHWAKTNPDAFEALVARLFNDPKLLKEAKRISREFRLHDGPDTRDALCRMTMELQNSGPLVPRANVASPVRAFARRLLEVRVRGDAWREVKRKGHNEESYDDERPDSTNQGAETAPDLIAEIIELYNARNECICEVAEKYMKPKSQRAQDWFVRSQLEFKELSVVAREDGVDAFNTIKKQILRGQDEALKAGALPPEYLCRFRDA
jgi:hypothetical protein